jgi:hypothetical protein
MGTMHRKEVNQMKRYIVEAYRPHVYMIKADNPRQAVQKAVARWQRAHHQPRVQPKVAVVIEAGISRGFWDSVDAAIDDYKERAL